MTALILGQAPNLNSARYLKETPGDTEVSLETAGSQLLLDQNNLHTTEAHLGVPHSKALQG